jgi:hypothetical protein
MYLYKYVYPWHATFFETAMNIRNISKMCCKTRNYFVCVLKRRELVMFMGLVFFAFDVTQRSVSIVGAGSDHL